MPTTLIPKLCTTSPFLYTPTAPSARRSEYTVMCPAELPTHEFQYAAAKAAAAVIILTLGFALKRVYLVVIQSEIMGDFVPQRVPHFMLQFCQSAHMLKHGVLKNGDFVRRIDVGRALA